MALAFTAFLFVILDLAVTWTAYSTMIISGVRYGAATSEAQRAALAAAAAYPSAILDSPLLGTYAILIPSLGILFAGLVIWYRYFDDGGTHNLVTITQHLLTAGGYECHNGRIGHHDRFRMAAVRVLERR